MSSPTHLSRNFSRTKVTAEPERIFTVQFILATAVILLLTFAGTAAIVHGYRAAPCGPAHPAHAATWQSVSRSVVD